MHGADCNRNKGLKCHNDYSVQNDESHRQHLFIISIQTDRHIHTLTDRQAEQNKRVDDF